MVILQDNQDFKFVAVSEDQLLNLEGNFQIICEDSTASGLFNVFIKLDLV